MNIPENIAVKGLEAIRDYKEARLKKAGLYREIQSLKQQLKEKQKEIGDWSGINADPWESDRFIWRRSYQSAMVLEGLQKQYKELVMMLIDAERDYSLLEDVH